MDPLTVLVFVLIVVLVAGLLSRRGGVDTNLLLAIVVCVALVWFLAVASRGRFG